MVYLSVKNFLLTAVAAALQIGGCAPAGAQTQMPSQTAAPLPPATAASATAVTEPVRPAATDSSKLETVVVTAQKVDVTLQKTPNAISVITPRQLEQANIRSVIDLDKQVPGVTVSEGGSFPLNVTIRGVGYEGLQNDSAQPGVAFVQNGVYIASPASLIGSFLDLDQIEVLRGPQGTVNGQNANGGALNVTTVAPELKAVGGEAEASYGSYHYARVRAAGNLPLGDHFAVRAALQREARDGWLDAPNQPGDAKVGDQDNWAGRLSALWKPSAKLSLNVWGEFFNNRSNGVAIKNRFDPVTDPRTTSNDYPTPQSVRSRIAAATLGYDLGDLTFKSISSYQDVRYKTAGSGDLLTFEQSVAQYGVKDQLPINDRSATSYTQEFTLASKPGGRLDWVAGLFFLRTRSAISVFEVQQSTPVAYTPNFNPTPDELAALFGAGLAFESLSNSVRESQAVYAQSTYRVTDRLRTTLGLRYSHDKSSADTSTYYAEPVPLESGFNALTGKGALEYDIAPASMVYASYSTGVKPGGTNLNPGSLVVPSAFEHETVRAYEIGSKNEFLDRKLRLNIAAFYNDYRDLQVPSEDPLPFRGGMSNVPRSHIYGLEGELTLLMPHGFRIDANAAAMRSAVDSDFLGLDPFTAQQINRGTGLFTDANLAARAAAQQNVKGNQLGRVPSFSSSIGIGKKSSLASGILDTFVQFNYRAPYWFRAYNNPQTDRVGKQFTMNFNARYAPTDAAWYAELNVTNVTGSDDVASRYAENFGVGAVFDAAVPPRQVIARVGFNY